MKKIPAIQNPFLVRAALVLLCVFLILISINKFQEILQFAGWSFTPTTISVTGESRTVAAFESADISLVVVMQAEQIKTFRQKFTKAREDIVAYLKSVGIADTDIHFQNYSVYPQYNYGMSPLSVTYFDGRQNLIFSLKDLSKMDEIISELANLGATEISPMSFNLKDKVQVHASLAEQALLVASQKAEAIAAARGKTLGKMINFNESVYPGQPYSGYPNPYELIGQVSATYELR